MPDVIMPRLSDTMAEGVLSQWLKAEGDQVRKGDVLAEIETDKATMELEAYDEGVLERLLVPEGATVPIGEPIAVIGEGTAPPGGGAGGAAGDAQVGAAVGGAGGAAPAETTQPAPAPAAEPAPAEARPEPPSRAEAAPAAGTAPVEATPMEGAPVRSSPLARRIAREHGIDLSAVTGSGPGGRIVRADVEAAARAVAARGAEAPAPSPPGPVAAAPTAAAPAPGAVAAATAGPDDEEIPLTAVRRVTARRLTESLNAPHFYLTSIIDAERLLAFRAKINERLADAGTKVSVTDMLIRACAVTLRAHPQINSSWGGDKLVRHRRIHLGVAVAIEDGLIVPVVRDADRKSVGEIAAEARTLAEKARAGRLTPDEFTGGTFTISNLGMYGIDHFTAVINPPEAAILAVGAATDEPAVRDGQLVARPTIKLTLSIDHRVVDGATAAVFLRDLKQTLEEPLRIVV